MLAKYIFYGGLWIASSLAIADDDYNNVLTIDRAVINSSQLQFPNDDNIYPKISGFVVVNYVLMSSPIGERWATVTLKNTASGQRKFYSSQLMALFADGSRKSPQFRQYLFNEKQTLTLSVNFGVSRFPMLEVYTRGKDG